MVTGFLAPERSDGHIVVRTAGERSVLALPIVPDPSGVRVSLLLRAAPGTQATPLALRVNGNSAGSVFVGSDWSLRHFELPEQVLVAGINELELVAASGVLVDRLWLTPTSARAEVDVGTSSARSQVSGFGPDQSVQGRSGARLLAGEAVVTARLVPLGTDYVLGATLTTSASTPDPISIFVNRLPAGEITPGASWTADYRAIPRSYLHAGNNVVTLVASKAGRAVLDRLSLAPLEAGALIDLGSADGRGSLVSGFSEDEASGADNAVWSDGPASRVAFFLAPEERPYRLSLRIHTLVPLAPLVVSLQLNGHSLGALGVASVFHTYDVELPASVLARGENVLALTYAATKQPKSFVAGSQDARYLGVRFDWLDVEPHPE
jgi:hypothetical protein